MSDDITSPPVASAPERVSAPTTETEPTPVPGPADTDETAYERACRLGYWGEESPTSEE